MKVRLLTNKTNLLAFEDLLSEINLNEESILIVPDKFSLSCEQMFFEQKKVFANFSMRVFSLTKLASLVLEEELMDKKLIDKNISLMIISSIITENLENFKYFKNIKDINKITEDIFNVVSQMLSSGVERFNNNIEGSLINKTHDLNLILNEYKKRKENYLIDASKKYDLFLDRIEDSSFIKSKHFYFANFNSLTSQVKKIIKKIAKTAKSTTLATSFSKNKVNNNEIYEFFKTLATEEIAGKSKANKIVSFIEENFFESKSQKLEVGSNVKLFEAKNVDDEIENLALEIKKDILFNNIRFKDISVCVANMQAYKDKINEVFLENGFSYFIDLNIKLLDNSYAKFLLSFVSLIESFTVAKIVNFIKSPYINLIDKIKNNFERFLQKYSLLDASGLNEFKWFESSEYYEDYLFVYENFVTKIYNFIEKMQKSPNIYDFFKDLNQLLDEFGCKIKLKEKIEYFKNKDILKYKQFRQIEEKIFNIEKNICEYYKEEFSLAKVLNFLTLCYEATALSVPATSVDSIFVGDYQNSYYKPNKKLYVVGANSENFPALKQDAGLFSDLELEKLETDLKIQPKIKDANRLSFYKALQVLFSFTDSVSLSYSLVGESGSRQFASNIFKNFSNRFLSFNKPLCVLKTKANVIDSFNENEILNLFALKLKNDKDFLRHFYISENFKEKAVLEKTLTEYYGYKFFNDFDEKIDKNLIKLNTFTASNLENYFTCPNKFLYKDVLKLKKFETEKLDARIFGNIVHSCVYYFAKNLTENETIQNEIIENVFNKKEFEKLKFLENSVQRLNNLKQEIKKLFNFILKQQQSSNFKLTKAEYKFNLAENNFMLKGFVDRIDETDDEFIVIDYKTGNTKIEYADIVFCKKIQLILYAKILEKILNKKCAGIYYLSLSDDFSKNNKLKIYLNGITKNSNNNLHLLDNNFAIDKTVKSEFFEFKEKYILNENEFNNLLNKTYQKVKNAIEEINNANFKASPLILNEQDSCEWCEFNEICKNKNKRVEVYFESLLEEILND